MEDEEHGHCSSLGATLGLELRAHSAGLKIHSENFPPDDPELNNGHKGQIWTEDRVMHSV